MVAGWRYVAPRADAGFERLPLRQADELRQLFLYRPRERLRQHQRNTSVEFCRRGSAHHDHNDYDRPDDDHEADDDRQTHHDRSADHHRGPDHDRETYDYDRPDDDHEADDNDCADHHDGADDYYCSDDYGGPDNDYHTYDDYYPDHHDGADDDYRSDDDRTAALVVVLVMPRA